MHIFFVQLYLHCIVGAKNLESLVKGVDYLEIKALSLLGNDHGAVVFFRSLGFG
jgi:hypothetical protein